MPREVMKNDVPELWVQRRKALLCPVCGKTADEFKPRMKVFCSHRCRTQYAKKYTFWSDLRLRIIKRDGDKCTVCGFSENSYWEIMRTKARKKYLAAFDEWKKEPKNRDWIEIKRNKRLVGLSESYEKDYAEIMDDLKIFEGCVYDMEDRRSVPHEERRGFDDFHLQVDHIVAVANGGEMWDEDNLRTICNLCHKPKTKEDMAKLKLERKKLKFKEKKLKELGEFV